MVFKNRKHSEETKKHLSKVSKRKYKNGYINPMKGKKRPDLSNYNKKFKPLQIGNKNPNWKKKLILICLNCKDKFKVTPQYKNRKFCSKRCSNIYYSIKRIGNTLSEKTRIQISKSLIKRGMKGNKNPNWQGGISNDPYDFNFDEKLKNKIRKKYRWKCQICKIQQNKLFMKTRNGKITNYKLCIHHIDYNKQNYKENNLIPLCRKCHSGTNSNRNFWKSHFRKNRRIK